jgi:hypothetical protein
MQISTFVKFRTDRRLAKYEVLFISTSTAAIHSLGVGADMVVFQLQLTFYQYDEHAFYQQSRFPFNPFLARREH